MRFLAIACLLTVNLANAVATRQAQSSYPTPAEGDYVIEDFEFENGEVLPQLNLHYTTIGMPHRNEQGLVKNAVLMMHGTTGQGKGFLSDQFAGRLFGQDQLLDATKYFIILPDAIGTVSQAGQVTAC